MTGYYQPWIPTRAPPEPKIKPERSFPVKNPGRFVPLPPFPSVTEDLLARAYADLRADCIAVEEIIGALNERPGGFTDKDLKRLDKGVTVIKVGFKLIKMVLRTHGFRNRLKPVPATVTGVVQ